LANYTGKSKKCTSFNTAKLSVSDSPKTFGVVAQLKQSANQQIIPKKLIIFLLFFERSDLVVNLLVLVARKN
jgi:hypothetical protein